VQREVTAAPAEVDLGALTGPVLAFGGPVSNLQATRAVLARARELGIPPGRVICTGDVVAYCGDPDATARLVRDSGIHVVMGNCEESLGLEAEDCGCGFAEGTACDALSRQWYVHARDSLSAGAKAWMRALPRRIDFQFAGRSFSVVHGGVSAINRFIFASASDAAFTAELDAAATDAVIGGHCGLPFTRVIDGRVWHNPGIIGVPANDGDTRVWYSLLSREGASGIRLSHHRLAYRHEAAARRMRETGLPEDYARALETGLWPSLDVLPEAERNAAGRPVRLQSVCL
jgi:diadenosine tetraphosphatase ApaH/serine/threonine PP2A family protein phosphatase